MDNSRWKKHQPKHWDGNNSKRRRPRQEDSEEIDDMVNTLGKYAALLNRMFKALNLMSEIYDPTNDVEELAHDRANIAIERFAELVREEMEED